MSTFPWLQEDPRAVQNPVVLFVCTGNATRSVVSAKLLGQLAPTIPTASAGTLVIEGQPLSIRTRAAMDDVGLVGPHDRYHATRQLRARHLRRVELLVWFERHHVEYLRREHPEVAARSGSLRRLARDLPDDDRPLPERVAALGLGSLPFEPWEQIDDPGGGETETFVHCVREIRDLLVQLAPRLRSAARPDELAAPA